MTHSISGAALHDWRQWAIRQANENDVDVAEADWFLQGLTSLSSLSLRLGDYQSRANISCKVSIDSLTSKWKQRVGDRTPIQYLVGETPWRDLSLLVTPDVLIPRPETELIIDIAKELVKQSPIREELLKGHWADLGTGSGAIAIALIRQFSGATVHAVDISEKACAIAQQNAQRNGVGDRIQFHKGSWLTPLSHLKGQLSAIVSNPPYIPTQTVLTLQPEVANYEPHLALDGGRDGLDDIRAIATEGATYLTTGGLWLIELMSGQAEAVTSLLANQTHYTHIQTHQDLSGVQRFVSARKSI